MNNKKWKAKLVGVFTAIGTSLAFACNGNMYGPCDGASHLEGLCGGYGTEPKWTIDWTSSPSISKCIGDQDDGCDGCEGESSVSCVNKEVNVDCFGNVTTHYYPGFSVTPSHASGDECTTHE